jgi:hypothetical protein
MDGSYLLAGVRGQPPLIKVSNGNDSSVISTDRFDLTNTIRDVCMVTSTQPLAGNLNQEVEGLLHVVARYLRLRRPRRCRHTLLCRMPRYRAVLQLQYQASKYQMQRSPWLRHPNSFRHSLRQSRWKIVSCYHFARTHPAQAHLELQCAV